MSYLLIGSVFLGIGAQASTVREVQTLSMPVTMAQVVLFGFASLGVGKPDERRGDRRGGLPLVVAVRDARPRRRGCRRSGRTSSRFAWQALWVALILRVAAGLFRRSVLKSGQPFRWPWQRRKPA